MAKEGSKSVASKEKITVRYGNHTYGCKNQAEYDAVMKKVDEVLKNFDSLPLSNNEYMEASAVDVQAREDVLNGKFNLAVEHVNIDYNNIPNDVGARMSFWGVFHEMVENGVPVSVMKDVIRIGALSNKLRSGLPLGVNGAPNSAYDVLFNKVSDCDAYSQLTSALYDSMGYNTAVVGVKNHSDPAVEINGKWFRLTGSYGLSSEGGLPHASSSLLTQPTR